MQYLTGFTLEELKKRLYENGFESYRAAQIFIWIYKHLINLEDINKTNLPLKLKRFIKDNFLLHCIDLQNIITSSDGTKKLIFKLKDNFSIESVLIPQRWKDFNSYSLCISTQVGCSVKCIFCASGKNGLFRNLNTAEIVDQVLWALKLTKNTYIRSKTIRNIVVMGMGEPLLNIENVIKALKIIHNPKGINIGWHKITLSTVGIKGKLARLVEEKTTPNIAISLHSADESLRKKLIPFKAISSIDEVLSEALCYKKHTKKEVTVEYVLIQDINDKVSDAKRLLLLLRNYPFKVNLIPYNPVKEYEYKTPDKNQLLQFENILRRNNIKATIRKSVGDNISAACGQLTCSENARHPASLYHSTL